MSLGAVFMDRDGTLIRDVGYLDSLDQIELMPGAVEAVKILNHAGYPVFVVTNQSGIARGFYGEEFVNKTHRELDIIFSRGGARITAWYFCPHYENGVIEAFSVECGCRKPRPGMAFKARDEWGIDLKASYVVGDKPSDVEFGKAIGARTVRIQSGPYSHESGPEPDYSTTSVLDAARWITAPGAGQLCEP